MNRRVFGQGRDLRLDGREDASDLGLRSFQIVDRADPERHGWDRKIGAPSKHLVQLLGAEIVGQARIGEAVFASVSPIAVQNDPDMARNRVRTNLTPQSGFIEPVEEAKHAARRSVWGEGSAK